MAKLGEGDPRWLVREREDGRNVGSWHWEEKTITKYATALLKEKLTGADLLDESDGYCKVKSVTKCSGEVTFCRRKGRNIFIYELDISAKWEAPFSDLTLSGEMNIASYGQDEPIETTPIKFTCVQKTDAANSFLKTLQSSSKEALKRIFNDFLATLDAEYKVEKPAGPTFASSDGIKIDPAAEAAEAAAAAAAKASSGGSLSSSSSSPASSASSSPSSSSSTTPVSAVAAAAATPVVKKMATKTLQTKLLFQGPLSEVFLCLTDPHRVSAFTGASAVLVPQPGEAFQFYNGIITGSFVSIKQNELIVQKWRLNNWPADHFSEVRIEFESVSSSSTRLKIKQSQIPSDEFERTRDGWSSFFWNRIKSIIGFHYKIE
eukprot:CAMPEP_0184368612 /NCGR_PEP_ID=MMETSP1089-20130417/161764_1 /TAXON_ID=38269 ORGANISM="Gloeochaete wittrockiana, Strain SAG46.84" /NCGR_SAMPLE_ID=MMETSP1089 /ASSEMBLY_ACC=CAM_ASM_000445 /LENGTH=375 /DNA_ID=CAMNT_0026710923 /DNA_START=100 /DNA_END=1227 /DNA_ORIENTATION=+